MNSRDQILQTLRRQIVPQVPLPDVVQGEWITYPDPVAKFAEMVQFAGASCHLVSGPQEIRERLRGYAEFTSAQKVLSRIIEIDGNVDLANVESAHQLDNLDFVIYPGQFAVAENGAIWVTDTDLRHRVCFFITQFLVLVVRRDQIVHNMHQAYQRATPPMPGFGLFLSGPSKTADIEQSLVIGAHGCRELQVFVV